jgi:muconolactone delta-isomerase
MNMKMTTMGQIIAVKQMIRINGDENKSPVSVEIGTPVQNQSNWQCPVRIIGLYKDTTIYGAPGNDALDSILAAVKLASRFLQAHPSANEFEASLLPNMGFPFCPITTTSAKFIEEQNKLFAISSHPSQMTTQTS